MLVDVFSDRQVAVRASWQAPAKRGFLPLRFQISGYWVFKVPSLVG